MKANIAVSCLLEITIQIPSNMETRVAKYNLIQYQLYPP
jgi:hypothetical protein